MGGARFFLPRRALRTCNSSSSMGRMRMTGVIFLVMMMLPTVQGKGEISVKDLDDAINFTDTNKDGKITLKEILATRQDDVPEHITNKMKELFWKHNRGHK